MSHTIAEDVRRGLTAPAKSLPPHLFYDEEGSRLYEQITELEQVVGEGEMWLGSPAKCARRLSEAEIEALYYSAGHYVRMKDDYLAMD